VTPDPPRRIECRDLRHVGGRRSDDETRDHVVLKDLLVVIDIVDEFVQRVDALAQPALDEIEVVGGQDARDHVEGEDALGPRLVTADGECDSHREQRLLGRLLPSFELTFWELPDQIDEQLGPGARPSRRFEQLVEEAVQRVAVEAHHLNGSPARRAPGG
jgi:hypothetical protein